ncbi:hypothetical protein [Flammeovirga pacifica]|uniref:Uncharacterized protein n=1 Tax=Flammeovirga pacifica TaxID=915059 RepID=A0A1S1Z2I5_FLAPC|nr:hypothetical protein [Flammeovirga pacifica]OHX67479.1 hypothetical protein NH26_14555 [Flammeovirga pacifica]
MKTLSLFTLLICSFIASDIFAQKSKKQKKEKTLITEAQDDIEKQGTFERDSSVFYFDSWMNGNVWYKSGKVVKDVPVLFDLEHDQVEIMEVYPQQMYGGLEMMDTVIKVIEVSDLKQFSITFVDDSEKNITSTSEFLFVNGDQFTREGVPAIGIYQLTTGGNGEMGILAYPYLLKTTHMYNSFDRDRNREQRQRYSNYAMNNPETYYTYDLKERYYLLTPTNEMIPVENLKKKTLVKEFVGREEEMKEYLSDLKIYYKSKEGLSQLVNYYNNYFK